MPHQTLPNPFLSFLEDEPEAAFFSFQNQFGGSPRQRQVIGGQFSNIFNQYRGQLGRQARSGQQPTGTFEQFLGNFDFDDFFGNLTASQRGGSRGGFAPPTRFV